MYKVELRGLMNLSENFIRKPVMTILAMATIAFFGVFCYRNMPVSDMPDVEFPTIQVSVSYPGADPQTIANNVVIPLEQQFTSIPGIQTISSTSYNGSATIVLQFRLNKSVDLAAPDVLEAINAASSQLPKDLPFQPTYSKVNPTATPVMFLVVHSKTAPLGELYDYAYSVLAQQLHIIEGVSQVETFGSPYAVRLQVDPQKLAARQIGIDEVGQVIQNANVYVPTGTLYGQKSEYTINVDGQMETASLYENLILKSNKGAIVRFKDVGRALDSVQQDKVYVRFFTNETNENMVGLAIQKEMGANTLSIINQIKEKLPELQRGIPASVQLYDIYDQSEYINESLRDVKLTLLIALFLVILVIFIYLGKGMNTLIPALAIPMSVLGTFIVLNLCGFSIDILSLLAITLAIGFLVDDAIVVLENIVRRVEHGEAPYEASLNGSKQISFTILSMTLCLCAVFIPLLFMEGIIGRVLHEFAVTITTAVLFSGFISLSLTPLLCSRFIPKYSQGNKKTKAEQFSEKFNEKLLNLYRPSLKWALSHRKSLLTSAIVCLGLAVLLFIKLPKDFLPGDDIGFIELFTVTQDGTSPFQLQKYQEQVCMIVKDDPNVDSAVAVGGTPQENLGIIYIRLKNIHERKPMDQVIKELYVKIGNIPGLSIFLKPVPLINLEVGTSSSRANYQFILHSLNTNDLYKYTPILMEKMKSLPGFSNVTSDLDIAMPSLKVEILRDKAYMLNVTASQIENALSLAFGNILLSPIHEPANQYYVILEVLPKFYRDPSQLSQLWLRSSTNDLVPLSAVVKMKETLAPLTINRHNGLTSATISFNIEGIPLGTGLNNLETLASQVLPATVAGAVEGSANIFKTSFANLGVLLLITIFIIYVILGTLYENFFPPITVMSTLPVATLGGLLTLMIFDVSLSLYAVVGLILLLGIVMKNGIIMVDFANEAMLKEKKNPEEAIYDACIVRFRPILMTTISAMMGAVPIALGIGGLTAQGRRPLGMVIVGGLIFSQVLTLYLTPVVFIYMEKLRMKSEKKRFDKNLD